MSNNINGNIKNICTQKTSFKGSSSHPFHQLTPDFILNALDELGYITDSRLLENFIALTDGIRNKFWKNINFVLS